MGSPATDLCNIPTLVCHIGGGGGGGQPGMLHEIIILEGPQGCCVGNQHI